MSNSLAVPQTVACRVPLTMGFPRWEYWRGCWTLLQGILLTPGLNLRLLCLLHWQADSLPPSHLGRPGKPLLSLVHIQLYLLSTWLVLWKELYPFQNSYVEALFPSGVVIGDGDFGRSLCLDEVMRLVMGLVPL